VAKEKGLKLMLPGDPRTIMHSINVGDCGETYLAIAECQYRKEFEEAVRAEDMTLLRIKPRFEKSIKHHFPSLSRC
jgi:hypothetical protein